MTFDPDNFIDSILESLGRIDYIKPDEMPDVALYVDQVTTLLQERLKASKRNPNDKVMTKTMINNYAKNDLLPSPVKKRYSKNHLMMLIFIYYFKSILSINDIDKLLKPMSEQYFSEYSDPSLEEIYKEAFKLALESQKEDLQRDVEKKANAAAGTFGNISGRSGEYLRLFSFISTLTFDVYVKKLMIEKLIDLMPDVED